MSVAVCSVVLTYNRQENQMPTKVKRASAFNPVQIFTQHLALKADAAKVTERSDSLKKRLKEWLPGAKGTYQNDQGSIFYDLDETVEVAGQSYKGMELRRAVQPTFDDEKAEKVLKARGVYLEAVSNYVDQNKVLRLHQEGKISDDDLDEMFGEKESFAFWPVKGEVL